MIFITHNSVSITHNSKMVGPIAEKSVWHHITLFPFFVSITQFSDFWVMSYGNWKHILAVFSFHNSVFNDIFVIKHTWKDLLSGSAAAFDIFFSFFSTVSVGWVLFYLFLFIYFIFTVFGEFGYWKKKKKVTSSDKYEDHKQCEKYWVMKIGWWCQTGVKNWVMSYEWWVMSDGNWGIVWFKKNSHSSLSFHHQLFIIYHSSLITHHSNSIFSLT